MEENEATIPELFEKSETYIKNTFELYKLKAIEKIADLVSSSMSRFVLILFLTLFFFSLNIGVSLWLGELLGKSYYGFFVVSGANALVGILIYLFRNTLIKKPISHAIITQALK